MKGMRFLATLSALSTLVLSKLALSANGCFDQNSWYPYIFESQGKFVGILMQMTQDALNRSGIKTELSPLPWDRCLKENAAKGISDLVIGVSYKAERAEFLEYPPKTESESTACSSEFKMICAAYVVVTSHDEKVEYAGNNKLIPTPVRAPQGYSITKDLESEGIKVDVSKNDIVNLRKLLRDKTGSVVMIAPQAELFAKESEFKGKIKIHKKPMTSKSYYLAFSKKSSLKPEEKSKIWKNLQILAADSAYMEKIVKKATEVAPDGK